MTYTQAQRRILLAGTGETPLTEAARAEQEATNARGRARAFRCYRENRAARGYLPEAQLRHQMQAEAWWIRQAIAATEQAERLRRFAVTGGLTRAQRRALLSGQRK